MLEMKKKWFFIFCEKKSAQEGPISSKAGFSRPEFHAEYRYLIARFIQSTVAFRKPKNLQVGFKLKMKKVNFYIFANKIGSGGTHRIELWSF